jgi:putative aminopeptidase FrvX
MLDTTELICELVVIPGAPGQEEPVRDAVATHVSALGYEYCIDAKGNLLVTLPSTNGLDTCPYTVVTAHLDEVALMVSRVERDGSIRVVPMGGLNPWKWGEQPVEIWTANGPLTAINSFGSTHTDSPLSSATQARTGPLTWEHAFLFTGHTYEELMAWGVRPGTRVTLARGRRTVTEFGPYIASYFLDDRADLASWLLALEMLRGTSLPKCTIFAATVAEEVGGEGVSYLLHQLRPNVCVALEIGPSVPESRFCLDDQPSVWVNDSFAAISGEDLEIVANVCSKLGLSPHWQALSRGGSDASITASRGLAARGITFGLPVENSHGYEIMHRDAPVQLARLLTGFLREV